MGLRFIVVNAEDALQASNAGAYALDAETARREGGNYLIDGRDGSIVFSDRMEPEDVSLHRDLRPLVSLLNELVTKRSSDWPQPAYPGDVPDVGDQAARLYEEFPTDKRVFTVREILEMINSWGRPIEDDIDASDIDGYVEHMAAGGYVIGRPGEED